MSKPTRAQIAAAFKAAKKYLSHYSTGRKADHICFALAEAHRDHKFTYAVWQACRNIIRSRLQGCIAYDDWVQSYGGVPRAEIYADRHSGKVLCQAGRHAWLNDLIREHSK